MDRTIKKLKCIFIIVVLICQFSFISYAEGITDIEKLFLKKNYTGSIIEGRKLLSENLPYSQERHIYYLMGVSFLKLTNTDKARYYFKKAISSTEDSIAVNSNIGIADAYFLDKDFHKAIDKYKDILSNYSYKVNKSNIYFKLGQGYRKIGAWSQSKKYFRRVRKDYPLSFESYLAKDILDEDVFYFTVQVGSFVNRDNAKRLYLKLKRKGYPAFIDEKKAKNLKFYRVRIGKFDQKFPVYEAEKELKKMGLPTKIYP